MAERATGRLARWLLPAMIVLPFAAAVVVDVVRVVRRPPAVDRPLLELSALRFEPADPVFDLRPRPAGAVEAWERPALVLASGWGQAAAGGRWTAAAEATIEIDLSQGGQRALLVEARADRGTRGPLLLAASINGAGCGRAKLGRQLAVCRFSLPTDAARPGVNQLELELVDARTGKAARGRTALVRRIAACGADGGIFEELGARPELVIDRNRGTVLIQRAGRLLAPFSTPRSGSVLSGRLRFREPAETGWCQVVIARRYAGPDRFDIVSERRLDAARSRTARIRQQLSDRQEPVALIVEVSPAAAAGGVVLEELRVEVGPKR